MEANKIMNADILDILFEGKNKAYGAYQLRKTYNSRMVKAMLATGALLLLLGVGFLLANITKPKTNLLDTKETEMAELKKDEPPPPPPVAPPPPPPPPPPEIKTIQFTPPVIKKDELVKKDEVIKDIPDDAKIATEDNLDVKNNDQKMEIKEPPKEIEKSDVGMKEEPKKVEDEVFQKVEIESEFEGGPAAWKKFLEKNLGGDVPKDKGAPAGRYTVIVKFIVAKDGTVRDMVAESNNGYGMEEEVVRVLKKANKWKPGIQNGNQVTSVKRQPVVFLIEEDQ
jgi:periplasmic protein TonB